MYFTYVLKSLKNSRRYVGYTSKDPEIRLKEHNKGCSKWTRQNKPLILIYKELFETKKEAMKREKFLKTGQGRKWLNVNNIK